MLAIDAGDTVLPPLVFCSLSLSTVEKEKKKGRKRRFFNAMFLINRSNLESNPETC